MRRLMVLLAAMAVLVVGYAGTALAATVVNGGFETGDLSGWTVVNEEFGGGDWYVCSSDPAACPAATPSNFPPPEGTYAAIGSSNGPGSHILYQDVTLEAGATHQLSFTTWYDNQNIFFHTPDSLSYQIQEPNQQYRIDIMKPDAPVDSVAPEDILATVFRTEVGDPSSMAPTTMIVDLSQFAGSTVRLRFAEVDNQFYFVAGVDDVKVTSVPTTDTTAPTVTATSPDGTVSRTATVTASFDEEVQNVTSSTFILERNIAVKKSPPKYVLVDATVSLSEDGLSAELTPVQDLPKGDYRATITTDVTDVAGNPLEEPVVWTFNVAK
jgi:Bacterial Ig-like domain